MTSWYQTLNLPDREQILETVTTLEKHQENDKLVPGEGDALEVAVKVTVAARHDRHVAIVVVVQHLPRVLLGVTTTRWDLRVLTKLTDAGLI